MEHKFIKFAGIEWNATHIASLSQEQFLKESSGNQLKKHGDNEKSKLIEVYNECKKAVSAEETPAKPEADKAPKNK